jgi:hypothetical protein
MLTGVVLYGLADFHQYEVVIGWLALISLTADAKLSWII